jgi:hypothetical protein
MTPDPTAAHSPARDPADVLDHPSGKVRVLTRQCATCIFRPGDPMQLGAERTLQVINHNLQAGALLTCHATLPYGDHPEFGPAVCAGFWSRHRNDVLAGRMAQLFLGVLRVDPPGSRDQMRSKEEAHPPRPTGVQSRRTTSQSAGFTPGRRARHQ